MFQHVWSYLGYPLARTSHAESCTQLKYACQMAALLASFMQGKTCKAPVLAGRATNTRACGSHGYTMYTQCTHNVHTMLQNYTKHYTHYTIITPLLSEVDQGIPRCRICLAPPPGPGSGISAFASRWGCYASENTHLSIICPQACYQKLLRGQRKW